MAKLLFSFFVSLFFCNKALSSPVMLSLDEAILLAARSNPNVQSSRLDYVLQKFNEHVQEWQFYPHYAFQASAAFTRTSTPNQPIIGAPNNNIQPGITLTTPIGTQLALTSVNNSTDHFNPGLSLQITQQLLRGFGRAVVEAALNNARDSKIISRLNVEGVLQNTISEVINAYLDVISAKKRIAIDEDALERAQKSVEHTKLFIKAGHKAGNELVVVEANVAMSKTALESDKNNFVQAQYSLLTAIGIDPNTKVNFTSLNLHQLIKKYHLPTMDETKKLTLENDIQYQVANITLHGSVSRNLLVAKDNARWQLTLTANAATGNGSGSGQSAGINSLFNGVNQTQSLGLTLQIPIDDQIAKQAVLSARIALKNAELSLLKEKWSKETSAINGWNNVIGTQKELHFAERAEQLQEKTYRISYQKYEHGLIDSLELQSAQLLLNQAQQTLLEKQITYIKALVKLDLLIGHTLKTWDIKVRL